LNDKIGRSYAILRYAHIISTKEALELLSMLRLGVDLGYFSDELRSLIDVLFMEIQPAHLQVYADRKLNAEERDCLRAEIMRDRLKNLPEPSKFFDNSSNELPSTEDH